MPDNPLLTTDEAVKISVRLRTAIMATRAALDVAKETQDARDYGNHTVTDRLREALLLLEQAENSCNRLHGLTVING